MANKPLQITTPVGRLIGGSLYDPRTTNYDGAPLVVKNGPNAGQPRVDFSFGVAIPKNPGETHFSQHPFFAPIWAFGHAAFTAGEAQRADFSWKIIDGDSTIPNKRGKKPCDQEGHKGHWILWFSSGTAPKIYNASGTELITAKDAVKPGYYVQVFGNVNDNKPSASPGIYVNHSMVALAGYGAEISTGPDVSAAGFGQGVALPPGASLTPPAGMTAAPPPPPVAAAAPAPLPLIPNLPAAVAPPPPVALPAFTMTAKANGATREAFLGSGWTDAMLIEQGYMTAAAVPIAPPAPTVPLPVGSAPTPPAPVAIAVAPPLLVTPNPAILGVPGAPIARQMTASANGATYEAMIGEGWTDALLVQHGHMLA